MSTWSELIVAGMLNPVPSAASMCAVNGDDEGLDQVVCYAPTIYFADYVLLIDVDDSWIGCWLTMRITPSSVRLGRVESWRAGLPSSSTLKSTSTDVPDFGVLDCSLGEVCSYIDAYKFLYTAEILYTESYAEWTGTVIHRFVI